jgi:hypothetical protein
MIATIFSIALFIAKLFILLLILLKDFFPYIEVYDAGISRQRKCLLWFALFMVSGDKYSNLLTQFIFQNLASAVVFWLLNRWDPEQMVRRRERMEGRGH